MSTQSFTVAELKKNSREVLKVSLSEYLGFPLADVRTYAPVPGSGVLAPTKKGISVRVDMLPDLIAALQQAEAKARDMGWIGGEA